MTFGHADNDSLNMEVHVRLVANDRKGKERHVKCQATGKEKQDMSSVKHTLTCDCQSPAF